MEPNQIEDCGCNGDDQMAKPEQPNSKKISLTRIVDNIFVSDVEKDTRMKICEDCEYFDPLFSRCSDCGCFLEVKTRLKMFHCPLNPPKW